MGKSFQPNFLVETGQRDKAALWKALYPSQHLSNGLLSGLADASYLKFANEVVQVFDQFFQLFRIANDFFHITA